MPRLFLSALLFATLLCAQPVAAERPLLARDQPVPTPLATERFVLRPAQLRDAALDHDAIASSVRHIDQEVYPGGRWAASMTLEKAQVEMGYYQYQAQLRRGFAYLILDPAQQRSLGRVYVWPSEKRGYDAMLNYFVRESELPSGLAEDVDRALRDWLARDWPFKRVVFYRELGSAGYRALPNKQWVESPLESPVKTPASAS
jgi:hypothetical protein